MSTFLTMYQNAKFFSVEYVNDIDRSDVASAFPVNQLADFSTCEVNKLDYVFSYVTQYISPGC